jgi:hypothetical protein
VLAQVSGNLFNIYLHQLRSDCIVGPPFTVCGVSYFCYGHVEVGRQNLAGGSQLRSGQTQLGELNIGEHGQ